MQNSNHVENTHSNYNAFVVSPETVDDPNCYLDSGASHHITNNPNNLNSAEKFTGKENLTVGNGQGGKISHISTSYLKFP